jgi:WD40 repeat protein
LLSAALTALLVLAIPGLLFAQPGKEPPPKEEPPPAQSVEELHGKVSLALNTGGHTEPIQTMLFTPDGKKFITARGAEVRVWNVTTGKQEQVWRLPGGTGRLAVSPDGKMVATAGPVQGGKGNVAVWLLPLKTGKPEPVPEVIRLPLPASFETHSIRVLAFSPDGSRLACGEGYWVHVYDRKWKAVTHNIQPPLAPERQLHTTIDRLIFSKEGNRLLIGLGDIYGGWPYNGPPCHVWDVTRPAQPLPGPEMPAAPLLGLKGSLLPWAAWSADNEQFAVLHTGWLHDLVLWSADGTPQPRTPKQAQQLQGQLQAEFGNRWWWPNGGIHCLGKTDKVVAAHAGTVVLLDPQTGKVECLYRGPAQSAEFFTTAVSPDGKLLAVTGDPGYQVILIDVATKQEVGRLGSPAPVPKVVGWGRDSKTIFWGVRGPARGQDRAEVLTAGLNLATLQPPGEHEREDLRPGGWNPDHWKMSMQNGAQRKDKRGGIVLVQPGGTRIETSVENDPSCWTFYKDSKDQQDRVVITTDRRVHLYDLKTNKLLHTIGGGAWVVDVAVSPDGKYLLVSYGQQFLQLFNIEAKPQRLLNILAVDEDWVAWTPEGYYAATPGGEKLIGWQVKKDDSTPLTFYPVERFRKLFYKPDLIKQLLETGSVAAALKAAREKEAAIEDVLPPSVRVVEVAEIKAAGKARLRVTAEATAGAKEQPVESLRLLLDGRAHPAAKPEPIKPGAPAKAVWVIEPLPGQHELKVLARCPDVAGVSEAYSLNAALADKDRPVLYRVCVGINQYDQKGLTLGSAKQDAEAVFDALEQYCTGPKNRFREAKGNKLLEKGATRAAVLAALEDIRKGGARPGDLLVVFFAGHGVVQGGEFYLLTREADTGQPLKDRALSGEDLRLALGGTPCSVLLLMDACHSAAGVRFLKQKPATDDLARSLTDDQVAVTVLAAAMGHETAGERPGHGLFNQALLEGLQADKGALADPADPQLYVHDLYSLVFRKVRKASEGRQNPFLNMPWTVPPLALRQVSDK